MPDLVKSLGVFAVLAVLDAAAWAETPKALPKIDGRVAVASVNGEPITVETYLDELGAMHAEAEERGQVVPKRDPRDLLDRLIDVKLILQEAVNVGLDELPEFRSAVAAAEEDALRAAVLDRPARGVPPPAPERVETLVRERVVEFEVVSVMFATKEAAEAAATGLEAAPDFAAAGRGLVEQGTAEQVEPAQYLARARMLPGVVQAVDGLADGATSDPVAVGKKFAVIKVIGRRYPENPEVRAAVREEAWGADRTAAVRDYVDKLKARRIKVNESILESLDFDADPKVFDRFLEDDRIVARVRGAEPVRVRDLAAAIKKRLFHGVEQAGEKKRLNKAKGNVLEELTTERAIQAEGRDLKLDRTSAYQAQVRETREQTLFGLFVGKVLDPSVKIDDAEVRKAYEAGVAEFTSPEMLRLDAIAFVDPAAGSRAAERLRAGADLAWMKANAEGRVDAKEVPDDLRFQGQTLVVTTLREDVLKATEGASAGDIRTMAEASGRTHVFVVLDRVPAKPEPFESVRMEVARRVYSAKRADAFREWVAKLREASDVEIFATSDQLRDLAVAAVGGP